MAAGRVRAARRCVQRSFDRGAHEGSATSLPGPRDRVPDTERTATRLPGRRGRSRCGEDGEAWVSSSVEVNTFAALSSKIGEAAARGSALPVIEAETVGRRDALASVGFAEEP